MDDIVTTIQYEINRITNLLKQLKEFASPTDLELKQIDATEVLDDRLKLFDDAMAQRDIKIVKKYNCPNTAISADFDKLGQVFLNLFQNATDAMPQGGMLTVSCESSQMPDSDKEAMLIKTEDTGFGIHKDDMSKIFDPFHSSTKHGTGLGLAVSHQIIKNHGGMIQVESELRKGTTFFVFLPKE